MRIRRRHGKISVARIFHPRLRLYWGLVAEGSASRVRTAHAAGAGAKGSHFGAAFVLEFDEPFGDVISATLFFHSAARSALPAFGAALSQAS